MNGLAWMLLLLLGSGWNAQVTSVKKRDLPDDFPLLIFHAGFAVIEVELVNGSDEDWSFDPAQVELRSPKGKRLKRALVLDIVPKLIRSGAGTGPARVHGSIYGDGRTRPSRNPQPGIDQPTPDRRGPPPAPTSISLDQVKRLRTSLESHQLTTGVLKPGERRKGFLYFKSKRSGARLRGGELTLSADLVVRVTSK